MVCAIGSQAMAQSAPVHVSEYGPQAGAYEFLLSGSGGSTKSFDSNTLGATGSFGKYMTDNVLLSVRQSVGLGYAVDGPDTWNGSSVGAVDYVFDLGRWRPFVGVFVGAVYGKGVDFDGVAGAEGGVKYYANKTTFIQASASYGPTFTDGFNGGNFQYTLGMGLNF
jgi:hypothetical protein